MARSHLGGGPACAAPAMLARPSLGPPLVVGVPVVGAASPPVPLPRSRCQSLAGVCAEETKLAAHAATDPSASSRFRSLLCPNGHAIIKLKVALRRHQGIVTRRWCHICGAPIQRHESHWRCSQHCSFDVCKGCFGDHWRSALIEAREAAEARVAVSDAAVRWRKSAEEVLRAVPPQLRGCGLYAEIAERWGLEVPHPVGLVVHSAQHVPGGGDFSLTVEALCADGRLLAQARTYTASEADGETVWEQVVSLSRGDALVSPGSSPRQRQAGEAAERWDAEGTTFRFSLSEIRQLLPKRVLGRCEVPVMDLLRKPSGKWMLFDAAGDAVLGGGAPHFPCEVSVSLVWESLPPPWRERCWASESPITVAHGTDAPSAFGGMAEPRDISREGSFPFHAFLMTRGTRGDVQPFISLARGLAEQLGWMVTICTELRFKTLLRSHSAVSRGRSCGSQLEWAPRGGRQRARERRGVRSEGRPDSFRDGRRILALHRCCMGAALLLYM